ncbi:SGNH/GDSL hydrolase family protein [Niabella terrae]
MLDLRKAATLFIFNGNALIMYNFQILKMSKLLVLLVSLFMSYTVFGQATTSSLQYTDALAFTRIGQAFALNNYQRIDTLQYPDFPRSVKKLLTHAAGVAVSFTTNSPRIAAKWCVSPGKTLNNMTAIANKGLDLYIKKDDKWVFAGVGRPTETCNESVIVAHMEAGIKECLLYLPTYDAVHNLSIGIDTGFELHSAPSPFTRKKVVVYGSSITQGASASRPGMAYPARLSRQMGIEFINLGLSGAGKMEREVADMVASIQADAFILDCFANPSPEQISARTVYMVKAIRARHPQAPIILIQSVVREKGNFDLEVRKMVARQNANAEQEFEKLVKAGVKGLYLIRGDKLLGADHEGTIDGAHPNDLGFDRMIQVIEPFIGPILN